MRTFSVPSGRSHLKPSKSTRPARRTLPVIRSLSNTLACASIMTDFVAQRGPACLIYMQEQFKAPACKLCVWAQAGSGYRGLPETMKAGYEAACW